MPDITKDLEAVEELVRRNASGDAEAQLTALVNEMGVEELRAWKTDIAETIGHFLPKRQKRLLSLLEERLGAPRPGPVLVKKPMIVTPGLPQRFARHLEQLSREHIFQWSTYYREVFLESMTDLLYVDEVSFASDLLHARQLVMHHASEIFQKGYVSKTTDAKLPHDSAIMVSAGGLRRFLDLIVEVYTAKLSTRPALDICRRLRLVASSLLSAVIEGYGDVQFGRDVGWIVLPAIAKHWLPCVGFMSGDDLELLSTRIAEIHLAGAMADMILPCVRAIDEISTVYSDYLPIPLLSQFDPQLRRLTISVVPPPETEDAANVNIAICIERAFVTPASFEEMRSRGIDLIVGPLSADLLSWIATKGEHRAAVVAVSGEGSETSRTKKDLRNRLEALLHKLRSQRAAMAPLRYNIAREFPLQNPLLTQYYHVHRSSVQLLMRTFERRNGVRLWCSVRRSGKTTACFELNSTTGGSIVVPQTCDSTNQHPNSGAFYQAIVDMLDAGRQIDSTCFADLVQQCAPPSSEPGDRYVFILDEYETFFGRIRSAVRRDDDLRYTVVQPLLNQMVAFARDNLIVFMGQQPNAHYILMEQNQLSAYVEQDAFPLFSHVKGASQGEFGELVRRVLSNASQFDEEFLDLLYDETHGHPYLTVKLLVYLTDWLIENRVSAARLLDAELYSSFARERLTVGELAMATDFDFFRHAVSEALTVPGEGQGRWLHQVYSSLQFVAERDLGGDVCGVDDFREFTKRDEFGSFTYPAEEILRTGEHANFYDVCGSQVRPKIRILGRIALTARKRQVP